MFWWLIAITSISVGFLCWKVWRGPHEKPVLPPISDEDLVDQTFFDLYSRVKAGLKTILSNDVQYTGHLKFDYVEATRSLHIYLEYNYNNEQLSITSKKIATRYGLNEIKWVFEDGTVKYFGADGVLVS